MTEWLGRLAWWVLWGAICYAALAIGQSVAQAVWR